MRYGAEQKPRAESGRNRWNGGNIIRYDGGRNSKPAGKSGIHGNHKLEGVVFDVLGNASTKAMRFKINVERCSEYAGSEFKDDPAGAAVAIRTRSTPPNLKPTKPEAGASEVNAIIWKDDYIEYKKKERVWAQTNPRIFNMVLGQCTQEMKAKLKGRKGWPTILKEQDEVALLKAIHRLCNQQDVRATGLMEIVTLERSLALNVQGKRSEVDYLRAFKANADAINLAGRYAVRSIAAAKLVAKE